MNLPTYLPQQEELIHLPVSGSVFLEGPSGTGKTTAAIGRLDRYLEQQIPAHSILILTPQRALAAPYYDYLANQCPYYGGVASILTIGGLSKRMVELFWSLIAPQAGFLYPERQPIFLTLETAQYIMARIVKPLLDKGLFESVKINRNRLYSQIIDNLNKSAIIGFSSSEIGSRLINAEIGEPGQSRVYEDAQTCSTLFRDYCLEHNLLDFSLQVELFNRYLWPSPICREYLNRTYRHVIFDNIEEDTPVTHDFLSDWLEDLDTSLIIFDHNAGYRRFLGADPSNAYQIKRKCTQSIEFTENLVTPQPLDAFSVCLSNVFGDSVTHRKPTKITQEELSPVLHFQESQFFPDMLDWISDDIKNLVDQGTPPEQIVVLSPFLSDSVRFALTERIEASGIPARSHRPSRALRDEPVTNCLLDLARLAHPDFKQKPVSFDIMQTLMLIIEDLDLVRASLLSKSIDNSYQKTTVLPPFDQIAAPIQKRITYVIGERYEILRRWLDSYRQAPEDALDIFLSRLFGEVLSQPGFRFHRDFKAGEITANLIESIQKFRWITTDSQLQLDKPSGQEYIEMVNEGVIAAQYLRSWQDDSDNAVLLAPAYTFLLRNQPVDYQFWLDVGSHSWYERLYQPLTHPHVLSRHWKTGAKWTMEDDYQTNADTLNRLIIGLIRRCRKKISMGFCEIGEQGDEKRGLMLSVFQRTLYQISRNETN